MTSQINPNNINDQYPVAGQPNNTQGFRDNFAGTKTNFSYAADEINELQTNAVLTQALTNGQVLEDQNNLSGAPLIGAAISNFRADSVNITTTSGSVAIDYSVGHYQRIATTGNISLSFSNWPPSGYWGWVRLSIIVDTGGRTLTLPAEVTVGTTGIQGYSGGVITFAAAGTYEFEFTTSDAGTTVTIFDLNRPLNRYTNGLLSSGATSGIGYTAGAGTAVTQLTDKSTGVTANTVCGRITMNNASLAAAAEVSFTLTNSTIAATDVVYVCIASGATAGAYNVQVDAVGTGSCRISLGNMSAGSLGEAVVLNFVVIKSAVS